MHKCSWLFITVLSFYPTFDQDILNLFREVFTFGIYSEILTFIWLVAWNIFYLPYIETVIIPIDEYFSEG